MEQIQRLANKYNTQTNTVLTALGFKTGQNTVAGSDVLATSNIPPSISASVAESDSILLGEEKADTADSTLLIRDDSQTQKEFAQELSAEYAKYGIPEPGSKEMDSYAAIKMIEWEKEYERIARNERDVNPVLAGIYLWGIGSKKDFLVKDVLDNPKEALEIQAVSQHLARKEFGETVDLFSARLKVTRGMKGAIDEVRILPYDSFTQDTSIAKKICWRRILC